MSESIAEVGRSRKKDITIMPGHIGDFDQESRRPDCVGIIDVVRVGSEMCVRLRMTGLDEDGNPDWLTVN